MAHRGELIETLNSKPMVVVGIAAYNEEINIAKVIVKSRRFSHKVLVCDDGSSDMTGEIARGLGAEVVRHDSNTGYGDALLSLFQEAREIGADILVTIDGDGQHDADQIPRLVEPIENREADVVIGSRFLGDKYALTPGYRKVGINIINGITRLGGVDITDSQSGFRAYGRDAIRSIAPTEFGMGASTELLIRAAEHGLRIKEIPIEITYGPDMSSQNVLVHGMDVVLATIKQLTIRHPLVLYGIPGLMIGLVAAVFWLWTFGLYAGTGRIVSNIALMAIGSTIIALVFLNTAVVLWTVVTVIRRK